MKQINWPKWRFLALLIALVLAGIALSIYGSRFWGHPAEAIGDALIIAGALGLTVDGYVKSHLLKEASQDISHYLLGYHLPVEIQQSIKKLMFTERISRDLHLYYKLTQAKDNANKVLVELTLSYSVENLSYNKFSYFQYFYQESIYSPRFIELRCDSSEPESRYCIQEEELILQAKAQEDAFEIRVKGPNIELPPRSSEHGSSYQFTTKCISLYPEDFTEVFVFDYPCLGVFIKAEYPANFVFEGPTKPDKVNRWYYPRLFLGGEQLTMRWRKRRKSDG